MPEIVSRFAERSIVGTYVVIVQLLMLYLFFPFDFTYQFIQLRTIVGDFTSDTLWSWLQPAMAFLAIVSVILLGVLFDLVGTYVQMYAITEFKKHLAQHEPWFMLFIEENAPHYVQDFREILKSGSVFDRVPWRTLRENFRNRLGIWPNAYDRCKAFMLTYVHAKQSETALRALNDALQTASIVHALAAATWLIMPINFLLIAYLRGKEPTVWISGLVMIVAIAFWFLLSMKAHGKVWHEAFTLIYLDLKPQTPANGERSKRERSVRR